MLTEECGEWIDKWALQPKAGGFQHKCKEISEGEIYRFTYEMSTISGIDKSIESLQALRAAEEDENRML